MKTKITLLAISTALLLTACGQKANDQIGVAPSPPIAAVQEETQPPQPSTGPTTVEQSPAAASTAVQERTQEENIPQVTQDPEPVTEPAPTEDIPSETVHAKTGYVELEPTPEPEPAPTPSAPADRQAAIDAANAYAVTQWQIQ